MSELPNFPEERPLIRDMELVRELLRWAAHRATAQAGTMQPDSEIYTRDFISYHIRIMVAEGLLEGTALHGNKWLMGILTWKGQDFLQAASDDSVWNQAKQRAGGIFNSLTLDVLMLLLKQVIKERLGLDL